jgi:hypothetical protein
MILFINGVVLKISVYEIVKHIASLSFIYHLKLIFSPIPSFIFCIDHERSNVFKETTQVLDNEGAKRNYKDLPAEGTAEQKSLVIATSLQRETVRRGAACMCTQEIAMLHMLRVEWYLLLWLCWPV